MHNAHGWSDYSPIGYILASDLPGVTSEPQSTINGTNVQLSWSAPVNTGGANVQIVSYKVELLLKSMTFITICQTSDLTCLVPMQNFT